MARIPLGDFGHFVAQPGQSVRIPQAAFDGGGSGAQKLGDTAIRVAGSVMDEQRQQNEALDRASAANAVLDREIAVKTIAQDIEQQLSDGRLHYKEAQAVYKSRLGELDIPDTKSMDPVTTENLTRGIKRTDFIGENSVGHAVDRARVADFRGQTDLALDKLGKLAGMPGADVEAIVKKAHSLDALGQVAYGKNWEGKKQEFSDKIWFNEATQRAMQNRDNMDGLKALESELTEANGFYSGKLDTDKRNAVLRPVIGDRMRLENRMQHDADRRLADAENAVKEYSSQITTTTKARPEDYLNWAERVRGTPFADQFVKMQTIEREVQKVVALPPEQQDKFLSDARAAQRVNGAGEKQIKMLNALEEAVGKNRKLMADEPLRYLTERTGQTFTPITPALFQQGGDAVLGEIRRRESALSGLKKTTGGRTDMKLFSVDEAGQIGKLLADAPVAAQGYMLGLLRNSTREPRAYADTVRQIAKDDPVLAYAGIAQGRNLMTTNGRALSDLLLEGRAIVRDGSFKMPTEKSGSTSMQQTFSEYVGNAIEPGSGPGRDDTSPREDTFKAASAVYAKLAKDAGKTDGALDSGLYEQAVRLVTGGVIEHAGYKTIPPYGMGEDVFNDRARSAKFAAEKASGAPAGSFAAMQLRAVGPNRYELLNGQRRQRDKDGHTIILTIE